MAVKPSKLFYLAVFLGLIISMILFALPQFEDKVLSSKQATIIEQLEKTFTQKDTVDVKAASVGEACAVLSIPDIGLEVPVYYGTSEIILNQGIGVLEGTSDINGGMGKHAVLTGHRGLSEKQLFTNLPKLKKGAYFNIKVSEGVHYYRIDKIQEVKADDLQANPERYIASTETEDYITLFTCTPLYINSHRLLVRGHRVKAPKKVVVNKKQSIHLNNVILIGVLVSMAVISLAIFLFLKRRRYV